MVNEYTETMHHVLFYGAKLVRRSEVFVYFRPTGECSNRLLKIPKNTEKPIPTSNTDTDPLLVGADYIFGAISDWTLSTLQLTVEKEYVSVQMVHILNTFCEHTAASHLHFYRALHCMQGGLVSRKLSVCLSVCQTRAL